MGGARKSMGRASNRKWRFRFNQLQPAFHQLTNTQKVETPNLVKLLRGVGVAVGLLGGVAMQFLPDYFTSFVVFVYAALVIWGVDLFYEFYLSGRKWRVFTGVALVIVTVGFTFLFVRIDAPFTAFARISADPHLPGTVIGDIRWIPQFTDLRVDIYNSTPYDYQDLDIVIRPDKPVAKVGQVRGCPNIQFLDREWMDGGYRIASRKGFRMRCERLLSDMTMEIVLAVVSLPSESEKIEDSWGIGNEPSSGMEKIYGSPPSPSVVHIEGQYTVLQRRRTAKGDLRVISLPTQK